MSGIADAADFDRVAALYATARPSYPREAVDWLVGGRPDVVVDVGAGTGLFTRLLVNGDRTVIAVEPSVPMLDALRLALPGVRAVEGTAERIPLPDASADALTFAQAWHWVDAPAATAEAARVLRPGGRLGLVWNLRDERVAWVHALGAAMRADGDHYRGEPQDPIVSAPFGEPERSFVVWTRRCSADEILADVRSRSYFGLLSDREQRSVLSAVSGVLAKHAVLTRSDTVDLPYVTACFQYIRP